MGGGDVHVKVQPAQGQAEPAGGALGRISELKEHFVPQPGFRAIYKIQIEGKRQPLIIEINGAVNNYYYGNVQDPDVEIQMSKETMDDIIFARMTFQRAFMGGAMKMKGDFRVLRTLDQIFVFMENRL